jgi:hypothetical protein
VSEMMPGAAQSRGEGIRNPYGPEGPYGFERGARVSRWNAPAARSPADPGLWPERPSPSGLVATASCGSRMTALARAAAGGRRAGATHKRELAVGKRRRRPVRSLARGPRRPDTSRLEGDGLGHETPLEHRVLRHAWMVQEDTGPRARANPRAGDRAGSRHLARPRHRRQ